MDTDTGLAILGAAVGSAKVVEKILGPTADYIGGGLKEWTEKRVGNVSRIFEKTRRILGPKLDNPGTVPPRVLKGVLDEGSFCDDELGAEYFGGVLASSRSEVLRDDRGVYYLALVSRLTTYQIRTHFFFYHLIKLIFDGDSISMGRDRNKLLTFVPYTSYSVAMEFSSSESVASVTHHAIVGLAKEGLIEPDYLFGDSRFLATALSGRGNERAAEAISTDLSGGIIFIPSLLGVELFHWAYGKGDISIFEFLNPEIKFVSGVQIKTAPGFKGLCREVVDKTSEPGKKMRDNK